MFLIREFTLSTFLFLPMFQPRVSLFSSLEIFLYFKEPEIILVFLIGGDSSHSSLSSSLHLTHPINLQISYPLEFWNSSSSSPISIKKSSLSTSFFFLTHFHVLYYRSYKGLSFLIISEKEEDYFMKDWMELFIPMTSYSPLEWLYDEIGKRESISLVEVI